MKKLLVLVAGYPNNEGCVDLMYVHTRNKYYVQAGLDVTVLNFATKKNYEIDGVKVITLSSYEKNKIDYNIAVLHAANLRNHYMFLRKYEKNFSRLIFFYHGHEVLKINKVYPEPYDYVKKDSFIKILLQDIYDTFKLSVWKYYIPKVAKKSYFIFVSNWMKEEFLKWTKINPKVIEGRNSITYNSVDKDFELMSYDAQKRKEYDFITIRGYLDGSKYCVDIVNKLAWNTPDKKFLVIGKGEFFKYNDKAPNLVWENVHLNHHQIIDKLNKSKFALMPTRTDAQGLMMCEMAAFGIPVITSDIPVCHEIFKNFNNAYFIDNKANSLHNFDFIRSHCFKQKDYYANKTILKEIEVICM